MDEVKRVVDFLVSSAKSLDARAHALHLEKWQLFDAGIIKSHYLRFQEYEHTATMLQEEAVGLRREAINLL
ncbi:MAG: hypothetical protein ACXABY_36640, partial [Candidatus Thorarchaeota archaeon]